MTNIDNLYQVLGRAWDDEEDSVAIVEANSLSEARELFETWINEQHATEVEEIYIISLMPLTEAIEGRIA